MCKKVLSMLGCFYLFLFGTVCFMIGMTAICDNLREVAVEGQAQEFDGKENDGKGNDRRENDGKDNVRKDNFEKDNARMDPAPGSVRVSENAVSLSMSEMEETERNHRFVTTYVTQPVEEKKLEEISFSEDEIVILERIVEAEAGGEDEDGKLLVANVVLNRVRDEAFPDTVEEVVFQSEGGTTQFSPVANGRYHSVEVSQESKNAVNRALRGEDISEGALYFMARKYASPSGRKWFDENLTMLFQHGGHEFYK